MHQGVCTWGPPIIQVSPVPTVSYPPGVCTPPMDTWAGLYSNHKLFSVSLCRNLEEKRLLWRLLDVPGAKGHGGEVVTGLG